MKSNETRYLILALYVLMMLFLGAIYVQGEIMNDPETSETMKTLQYHTPDYQTLTLATTFHMSHDATIVTIVSLTILFGFGMLMLRSKSNSY